MASAPIDQGAILRSGMAAVPDYAEQQRQQQQLDIQRQQAGATALHAQTAAMHEQREAAETAAFQADVAALGPNPSAADFAHIMVRHPQMSEAINRGYQAMDESQRRTTFQSLAEINAAARGGDYALAARLMRERDQADTAAGHPPDPLHSAIQEALDSGDPARQAIGRDLLERATAAVSGPDHYASVYGTFSRNLHEMNGILYDDDGHAVSQDPRGRVLMGPNGSTSWLPTIPGVPMLGGGSPITPQPMAPQTQEPAPPAPPRPSASSLPGNGRPMPTGMFQGWTVIGVPGDPRRRANGAEVPHNGVDFRPPSGNPHLVADRPLDVISSQPAHGISGITAIVRFPDGAEFNMMHLAAEPRPGHYDAGQVVATAGNTGNARNGSTQIHVQPWGSTRHDPRAYFGGGVGTHASPVRVRTVQQAQALAPGTIYTTPDGQTVQR